MLIFDYLEKEHFYPKTKHTHPDVINVDAGNQLAPNLLWVEQKPPRVSKAI